MKRNLLICMVLAMVLVLCACAKPCEVHEFGPWETVKEATCTEAGERTRACLNCEEGVELEAVSALGHNFGEWSVDKEPTCAEEGTRSRRCDACGLEENENIPVIAHAYGEWEQTLEPDCVTPGEKRHICTVCGHEDTASVPALGHDYERLVCTRCQEEQYRICNMWEFYETSDGLAVQINSIKVTEREGYNLVRVNWTIKNVTENSEITHGQFILHMSDGTTEQMYGMFPYLYYKESYTFYYDWKLLKDREVVFVEYVPWDHSGSEPIKDAPHWLVP